MARTCRDVVTRAYRMIGVVSLADEPEAEEAEYALEALQGIYDGWFASGMFGTLEDYFATGDYEAEAGQRVTGGTVTFPAVTEDDAINETRAIALVAGGVQTNYIFTDGAWVGASALTLGDPAPLASRDFAGLSAVLAIELAEPMAAVVGASTVRRAGIFNTSLSLKRGSSRKELEGVYY